MVDREIGSAMWLRPTVAMEFGEGRVVPGGAVDDCFAASLFIERVGLRRCCMPLREGALGGRRRVAMVLCIVIFRRRNSPHARRSGASQI